jgi:hypothetical protein
MRPEHLAKVAVTVSSEPGSRGCWCAAHDSVSGRRRVSNRRLRRPGFSLAVRRSVPVRTFGDWNDPPRGFVEVDFIAHSGPWSSGSFVQTLVLTDIATGWTECVPVVVRTELAIELLVAALRRVDFDNDGAFMNDPVVDWCRGLGLEVTRSRAYRKNDQDRKIYSDDLGDGCGRVLEAGRLRPAPYPSK